MIISKRKIMKQIIPIILASLFLFYSCSKNQSDTTNKPQPVNYQTKNTEMKITSSSFKEGDLIPSKFTCDGENISPQMAWMDAPQGTKSFALIADDPDAPAGVWVHWVIYNIPPDTKELQEHTPKQKSIDNGALQGVNDFRKTGYDGPCPPGGTHRYYFKLYALDISLDKPAGLSKQELLDAMEGHILSQSQLMGKYKR